MKILAEYTLNYLKKNKKNTISILIAITIGTILLSTMVLVTYMAWDYELNDSITRNGNYHGSFIDNINKSQIPYLKENQKVDKVYLRSEIYSGKIDLERPYLNISYLNKDYWNNMPTKNFLFEGRLPEKSDEIVIMGSFIKENPQYKLGDKLNVKLGYRQKDGKKIDPLDLTSEGEVFTEEKEIEYTIVGTISVKNLSYEPSYVSLGFLDENLIDENIRMTPFLKMKNPRTIYKDLPEIGKTLGFKEGEESNYENSYGAAYNSYYLKMQGIFPASTKLWERIPLVILIFSIFILFVIFLFVIIIYNVFTVWSNNRLRQLGILKSIGATPKQIKKTVIIEAIFLSIIPITLGILLGHLFCYLIMNKINSIVDSLNFDVDGKIFQMSFKTSPMIVGIIVIFAVLTLLISINKPARRLSRMLPIEAIKHSGADYEHLKKKKKKYSNYSPSNIIPSLARDSLNCNKSGFRTTIISITISFVIMFIFLAGMGVSRAATSLNTIEHYYPLNVQVLTNGLADESMFKEIESIPEVKKSVVYKTAYLYSKVKSEYASEEFKKVGGFEGIDIKKYYIEKIDESYGIPVEIMGLEHDNFNEYVKSQGGDPNEYYDKDKPKAILLNLVQEDVNQPIARANFIPYLNNKVNKLSLSKHDKQFNIDIGLKTYEKPIKDYYMRDYEICLIVPKEILNSLMENFDLVGNYGHSEKMRLLVDREDITKVKEEIKDISKYYVSEDDFYIWSIFDDEAQKEIENKLMYLITFSIVFFLSVIGVSNAYSSINNNLRNRRREFAMLKSMGIKKKDLRKMLSLEGIYYSIYPFIFSIPICVLFLTFIAKINRIFSFKDLLMFLDYRIIIGYSIVIFTSIYLAYYFGMKKVEKDEIVTVLKD